jgi:BRCT domain type II-containing protein
MDKTLFKAYVRELVKETVEEEVRKLLPKVLGEAVQEIKTLQESTTTPTKTKIDRSKLAEMMGLQRMGDTLVATTNNMPLPENAQRVNLNDPNVKLTVDAITKDYSALMKKMGMSK